MLLPRKTPDITPIAIKTMPVQIEAHAKKLNAFFITD
jgi:hypothetical protein